MRWSGKGICKIGMLLVMIGVLLMPVQAQETYFNTKARHSFNVKNTDLADFLRLVARTYGVNLLYENVENKKITVALEDVGVNELLAFIMADQNLDAIHSGSIVKLFPAENKLPVTFQVEPGRLDGGFDVTVENAPLDQFCKRFSSVTGTNLSVAPHLKTHRISITAKDAKPEQLVQMLALQEGVSLTQEDGFYHFSGELDVEDKPQNMVVKVDLVQDDEGNVASYILTARNAPLAKVCEHIFKVFDLSHVFVDHPSDRVTLKVQSDRIERLLSDLMASTEATYFIRDGVIYVGNRNSPSMRTTELIGLSHIQVTNTMTPLSGSEKASTRRQVSSALDAIPEALKKELTITAIETQNSLLVTGKAAKIQELKELIAQIDLPIAQVLIEVLVVDFKRTDLSEFGLNISNGQNSFFPGIDVSLEANRNSGGNWQVTRLPSNFMVRVQALAEQGVVRIISKPHIATLNGVEAEIVVGEKKFYKVTTELMQGDLSPRVRTAEEIKDIEANISLKIKPYVTASGEVTVEIQPDFNTFLGEVIDNVPPPISYRKLNSTVRLQDGQTIIMGGLIQETISRAYQGLPWISKIPIIGNLFKNHDKEKENAELVIYITPHVYYGDEGSARIIRHDEGLEYSLDVRTQYEKEKKQKDRKEENEIQETASPAAAGSDSTDTGSKDN